MRNPSAALKTAAASSVTTLAWLASITQLDNTETFMNSFGANVTVDGNLYAGDPGFDISDIRVSDGRTPPSVEMMIPIDTTTPVTFADVATRKYDQARIRLYLIDWSSLKYVELGFQWYVGDVVTNDGNVAFLDVRAAERAQRELMLKVFTPGCQWDLGDSGCNVNVAGSWQDNITVASYVDAFTFTIAGPSPMPADDYYAEGAVKFTSGENDGFSYTVRRFTQSTGTVALWEPLRAPVAVSDTGTIHAGCDKSTGSNGCDRFSNFARRFAFDDMPEENFTAEVRS